MLHRRQILAEMVHPLADMLMRDPLLQKIQTGHISQKQWETFCVQRFLLAAPLFEDLLKEGISAAHAMNDVDLEATLIKNLQDEVGNEQQSAHSVWRHDFLTGMNINTQTLQPFSGTDWYLSALRNLLQRHDALEIAGAILALEGTIPTEFRFIRAGRDHLFPKLNLNAKLYIDDHILHDSASHYPDLLGALEKYVEDSVQLERIQAGITVVQDAKKRFYQSLEETLPLL